MSAPHVVVACLAALLVAAEAPNFSEPSTQGIAVGAGLECMPAGRTRPEGPASYLVSDIGKSGVPNIVSADRAVLAKIRKFVRSSTLRFVYLDASYEERYGRPSLGVFDAMPSDLCDDRPPGFKDLASGCNSFYRPVEASHGDLVAPGDVACTGTPPPWLTSAVDGRWRVYSLAQIYAVTDPQLSVAERQVLLAIARKHRSERTSLRWAVDRTRGLLVWSLARPFHDDSGTSFTILNRPCGERAVPSASVTVVAAPCSASTR